MTWIEYHRQSEGFASEAEIAVRSRQHSRALQLYAKAAQAEETALQYVEPSKQRTYGITAVSAVSLYFKASQYDLARNFAYRCLGSGRLPAFAIQQIDELLDSIKIEQAGVGLNGARILLSLAGGDLIPGGAPLDLVIAKAQKMKALLYRTTEYLKKIPHRRRGEPEKHIQDSYRPWLLQAAPGSYQFAVSLQEIKQLSFFDNYGISSDEIISRLFSILRTCAESPKSEFSEVVDNHDYRSTFLKLTRDLAPTGKRFSRLAIKYANADSPIVLTPDIRIALNDVIRANSTPIHVESAMEIHGILRALHLDNDWIEVREGMSNHRIEKVREEVDDRIGPMVNHPVIVHVIQASGALRFVDIEPDE